MRLLIWLCTRQHTSGNINAASEADTGGERDGLYGMEEVVMAAAEPVSVDFAGQPEKEIRHVIDKSHTP